MLQEICAALDLDVSSITGKRKKPSMDTLYRLVEKCSSKTMNLMSTRLEFLTREMGNRALTANLTDHLSGSVIRCRRTRGCFFLGRGLVP